MEHLTQKQVEDFSLHQLSTAELLAVSDHLGECEICRGRVEDVLSGDVAFLALHEDAFSENGFESAHLTPAQTADYVDQNLAGEALQVDDHLSGCDQCAFAVADLRAFRNEIAPSLDRRYGPTPGFEGGWRQKFASLFKLGLVPAFGAAALGVLVLGTIVWLVWRTPREQRQEVHRGVLLLSRREPEHAISFRSSSPSLPFSHRFHTDEHRSKSVFIRENLWLKISFKSQDVICKFSISCPSLKRCR